MFVFAGIVPHSPLLLPTIGKGNRDKVQKTLSGLKTLAENLYLARADTIIIFSSHATQHQNAFSINLHDEYQTDFRDFGDLGTSKEFFPDLDLVTQIQRAGRNTEQPITLDSDVFLDYGSGVPLELLTREDFMPAIVPIAYSGLSAKEHFAFGSLLKDVINESTTRIAVIASGDLSHCLSSNAPGGFHKNAQKFDNEIIRSVTELSSSTLLGIDKELRESAKSCIYEQLLILFGVIGRKKLRPEILSYEAPFGVGYLVAQFHL